MSWVLCCHPVLSFSLVVLPRSRKRRGRNRVPPGRRAYLLAAIATAALLDGPPHFGAPRMRLGRKVNDRTHGVSLLKLL